MLGYVIDECIQEKQQAGYVTKNLNRTVDWLAAEDTEFPGPPGEVHIRKNLKPLEEAKCPQCSCQTFGSKPSIHRAQSLSC